MAAVAFTVTACDIGSNFDLYGPDMDVAEADTACLGEHDGARCYATDSDGTVGADPDYNPKHKRGS